MRLLRLRKISFIGSVVLVALIKTSSTTSAQPTITTSDSLALVAIFDATGGTNWTVPDGAFGGPWKFYNGDPNQPRPADEWWGVGLQALKVFDLNMSGFGMNGSLPDDIGDLSALKNLTIAFNQQLTGPIPLGLGTDFNLEQLSLSNNALSGALPDTLRNLSKLISLGLGGNAFTGSIFNDIERLTQLRFLYLNDNQFSGPLPASLGALMNLEELGLSGNNFSGSIPFELRTLTNLRSLSLGSNNLSGSIPPELGEMSNLQTLSMSFNDLEGSLPPELGSLQALRQLIASGNNFSGSIPESFGELANIEDIALTSNDLTGDVPESFLQLSKLETLLLDFNDLSDIPDLTELPALRQLRLRGNRFNFDDLEPLAGLIDKPGVVFTYDVQQEVAGKIVRSGTNITLYSMVGGEESECTWFQNGVEIPNAKSLIYNPPAQANPDEFHCEATSSLLPGLTLISRPRQAMDSEVVIFGSDPPIPLQLVTVRAVGGNTEVETQTNIDGKYFFSLVPGPYTFVVEPSEDDKQIREIIEQPVSVVNGQVDFPTYELGAKNRREQVVNWARELQTFGNPNVIFNLDALEPLSTPYLDVMGNIELFAANFPEAPAATTEQLYRLSLAMRVIDAMADDVSDMSGDMNDALFDVFSSLVSLDVIDKKLTAALGKLVSKLNQFAIGKFLLANIERLSNLGTRGGGALRQKFQALRERAMRALLASLSPEKLKGSAKYVLSREMMEALMTKMSANAAYKIWKPTDAISGAQEYLGFGSELINAIYASSTQEEVIAALAEAKIFNPENDLLWQNQSEVNNIISSSRGERDQLIGRINTSLGGLIRDFAGAFGGAIDTLADLLAPLAANPSTAAVAAPVFAEAKVMAKTLKFIEDFYKGADLADMALYMYTRPRRLASGVAVAFDKESLIDAGKRDGGLMKGASVSASGVIGSLAIASAEYNQSLDQLVDYVNAENFDAYIDWLEMDFQDKDDAVEASLLQSDAILQSALLNTGDVDEAFLRAYIDLIGSTIEFDSARILLYYEILGFLFEAGSYTELTDPGYLQIRQNLFDAIAALQTLNTASANNRTDILDLAETLNMLAPTVLIESVETLANGEPLEFVSASPQPITVRAAIRNLGAEAASGLTASFEDPDPVLGFDMVFNSNQTLDQISVPPGDMVEVEWNVTYSGSLEERTAALFVTLDSENDDVIIPGGYSFDVSVFDSTDTDQDGMPDQFEMSYSLLVNTPDNDDDADSDGLTNVVEYYLGTDPQESDTDGDGYSDGDEVAAQTDALNPNSNPDIGTAIDPLLDDTIPQSVELHQNYPNPFNPETTISFSLPRAETIDLQLFDILGRKIATIESGTREAGTHRIRFNASNLPSGVYLYRLIAGDYRESRKMLVLK